MAKKKDVKKENIDFKGQVVMWADPWCVGSEFGGIQEEYESAGGVRDAHQNAGLFIKNIKFTDIPPLKGSDNELYYDLLLFDWGGMSIGNSMLESFVKYIAEEAQECPSKYYVMVSAFTSEAMEDALQEFGDKRPQNIFLDFESFVAWLRKYGQ
ncbi:MAG: hypothetical protein ACLP29_00705 [Dissulfurispiraceae bacterium]